MTTAKLARLHDDVNGLLNEIGSLPAPGTKLTLVARTPTHPDGSRDIVFTDDDLDQVVEAIRISQKTAEVHR